MTDFFKTVRAYLRGKWGRKRAVDTREHARLVIDASGLITGWESGPLSESGFAISNRPIRVNNVRDVPVRELEIHTLKCRIQSLSRAKKNHSHLQKQLDDLLSGRADITDQQTETAK